MEKICTESVRVVSCTENNRIVSKEKSNPNAFKTEVTGGFQKRKVNGRIEINSCSATMRASVRTNTGESVDFKSRLVGKRGIYEGFIQDKDLRASRSQRKSEYERLKVLLKTTNIGNPYSREILTCLISRCCWLQLIIVEVRSWK